MKSEKLMLIVTLLFLGSSVLGQNSANVLSIDIENELGIHTKVQERTSLIFDSLVMLRRDFHRFPEISEKEKRTSQKIEDYLLSLGLEVITEVGGYGVIGILNTGRPGKHIAWRADIDAIATDIPDVVDFSSKNEGVRHICGHDVHTTVGIGIADVLVSLKEHLHGTIYFIFQPAEEKFTGARAMIDDGLYNLIKPDEIYGLHISPSPTGIISTKPDNIYAHRIKIEISFGKLNKRDSLISYTKDLVSGLQTYDAKSPFWDERNILSPEIGVENPNSLYRNYVAVRSDYTIEDSNEGLKISTYVDASNMNMLNAFIASIKNEIEQSGFSKNLESVDFSFALGENKSPMNDVNLTRETIQSIAAIYGQHRVVPIFGVAPGSFGDDFTFFQNHTPGVYFFLGGSNYEKGIISMPHSPNFEVDEKCIGTGVNFFSSMIIDRLN